jgi:hypothetical protein
MLAGTLAMATAFTGYYLAVQTALRYANGAGLGMPPHLIGHSGRMRPADPAA